VLASRVKHGADNHEARCDGTFTHSKNETDGEKTGEILASSMATQGDSPDEYVQARSVSLQKITTEAPGKVCATCLSHFPTGNLWSAKFCGNSKARKLRKKIVDNLIKGCQALLGILQKVRRNQLYLQAIFCFVTRYVMM